MNPVSPVIPGTILDETVYAKNQEPYKPLPSFRDPDGYVLTRWHMTWRERLLALLRGDVYLWIGTFGAPLQPLSMHVERPTLATQIRAAGPAKGEKP